jgi:hypothetical protein
METIAEKRIVRYTDIVPAKNTVIGSKVVNAQNEDLGKIEDLSYRRWSRPDRVRGLILWRLSWDG